MTDPLYGLRYRMAPNRHGILPQIRVWCADCVVPPVEDYEVPYHPYRFGYEPHTPMSDLLNWIGNHEKEAHDA